MNVFWNINFLKDISSKYLILWGLADKNITEGHWYDQDSVSQLYITSVL